MADTERKADGGRTFVISFVAAIIAVSTFACNSLLQSALYSPILRWAILTLLVILVSLLAWAAGIGKIVHTLRAAVARRRVRAFVADQKATLVALAHRVSQLIDPSFEHSIYSILRILGNIDEQRQEDNWHDAVRVGGFVKELGHRWAVAFSQRTEVPGSLEDGPAVSFMFHEIEQLLHDIAGLVAMVKHRLENTSTGEQSKESRMLMHIPNAYFDAFRPDYNALIDDVKRVHREASRRIPNMFYIQVSYI